jgi:hypothetical protein
MYPDTYPSRKKSSVANPVGDVFRIKEVRSPKFEKEEIERRREQEKSNTTTMTDMYDPKRLPDFALPPYQHEDHGGPVS